MMEISKLVSAYISVKLSSHKFKVKAICRSVILQPVNFFLFNRLWSSPKSVRAWRLLEGKDVNKKHTIEKQF